MNIVPAAAGSARASAASSLEAPFRPFSVNRARQQGQTICSRSEDASEPLGSPGVGELVVIEILHPLPEE